MLFRSETVKEVIKLVPADTKALEQKLSVAQKEAQDLKGRMAQLQANKDKETAQVSEKFNDLKSQLSVSQEQFTALKTEILKNREIITAKQDQTITLQSSINEQIGKLAQTSAQIKQKDERMALQEMLQAKQRQHIDLLVRKNQLIADYQNSLVDKLNAYKQKFNGASNDWAVHAQEYAAKLAEFRASIDAMNNNNAQLNESIQRSKQEKDDAYQLMDRFKDRLKETADVNESQGKELLQYRQIGRAHV